MKIYEDLGLNYTDEISIRFIFHSAFMIERVIRREPLIYKNTNSIISTNREVYTSIDRNMELVNEVSAFHPVKLHDFLKFLLILSMVVNRRNVGQALIDTRQSHHNHLISQCTYCFDINYHRSF